MAEAAARRGAGSSDGRSCGSFVRTARLWRKSRRNRKSTASGPADAGLAAPLGFDPEEPGEEASERAGGVHEEAREGERVQPFGVGAIEPEALGQGRIFAGEPLEESGVQVRQPVLAVQILVAESGFAEREVPLGEGWRRGGLQEKQILASRELGAPGPCTRGATPLDRSPPFINNRNVY